MRFTEKKNLTAPLLLLAVCALTLLSRLVPYPEGNEIYLTVIVLNMLIFVLPAVFYARLQGQGYIRKMNLRPIGFSRLPVVLFLFFVLVSGSILLHYLLYVTGAISFGESESAGNFAFLAQTGGGASDVLLTALAFAVVPAAAEEFFFRGVFMSEYEDYGGVCQVVVSSIAFALVHFSASRLPVFLFCGFFLSLTAYITKSALASMLLHILFNLFAIFGEQYIWGLIAQQNSTVFFLFIVGTVLLLFLMLGMGEGERLFYTYATSGIPSPSEEKKAEEREKEEKARRSGRRDPISVREKESGKRKKRKGEPLSFSSALFSPTFLLCVALFLVVVLVN